MRESYLYPTLEAGSSRVFNICSHTRKLQESSGIPADEANGQFFFSTFDLNKAVIVKEPRAGKKIDIYNYEQPVGTKIFFPYDCDQIYKGGKSLFTDDRNFYVILREHAGFNTEDHPDATAADLALISVLQAIPSLDPFLVKDRLQIEGMTVNETYFDMPDDAWSCIRDHVAKKLSPIIGFVYDGVGDLDDDRADNLLRKLWNTKDVDSLKPIVETFRLPIEDASEIFTSWKGVMYFEYEYNRCLPIWKKYAAWLKNAKCEDPMDRKQAMMLDSVRGTVTKEFRNNWIGLKDIFNSYEEAYNLLFVKRKTPGPFIDFMKNSVSTYWALGAKICTISHCVSVWNILTSEQADAGLKYDNMLNLLEIERRILQGF